MGSSVTLVLLPRPSCRADALGAFFSAGTRLPRSTCASRAGYGASWCGYVAIGCSPLNTTYAVLPSGAILRTDPSTTVPACANALRREVRDLVRAVAAAAACLPPLSHAILACGPYFTASFAPAPITTTAFPTLPFAMRSR